MAPSPAVPPVPREGLSIAALREFAEQHNGAVCEPTEGERAFAQRERKPAPTALPFAALSTAQVVSRVIKPATEHMQGSYAELLRGKADASGRPHVGLATVFVSHAWDNAFADLQDALMERFGADEDVFLWNDIFVGNQHAAATLPQDWWATAFASAVGDIGHTVLVLQPWSAPLPLTRSWCLWEILATLNAPACRFDILLTGAQRDAFERTLRSDFERILTALCAIDTREAKAGKDDDKQMIDAAVKQTAGGYERVNGRIQEQLRDWVAQRGLDALARLRAGQGSCDGSDAMPVQHLLSRVGCLLFDMGRLSEAAPLVEAALRADPDDLTAAANVAGVRIKQGRWPEAELMLVEVVRKQRATLGDTHADTLNSLNSLATLMQLAGRLPEAAALCAEVQAGRRTTLGDAHRDTLVATRNLAALHAAQRDWPEAERLYRKAHSGLRSLLGRRHPVTLTCLSSLGALLVDQRRLDEAEPLCLEAAGGCREALGDAHPDTLIAITALAQLRKAQGELAVALPLFEEALRGSRAELRDEHPHTLIAIGNVAATLCSMRRLAEAEPLYAEVLSVQRATLGSARADTRDTIKAMARVLYQQRKLAAAEPLLAELVGLQRVALGDAHVDTVHSKYNLSALLAARGELGEADVLLTEVVRCRRKAPGDAHADTLAAVQSLACLRRDQGRLPEAAALATEALVGRRAALRAAHPDTLASLDLLATLMQTQGDARAEPLLTELLREQRAALGDAHADTLFTVRRLLRLLLHGVPARQNDARILAAEALERLPAAPDKAAQTTFCIFAKALEACSDDGCKALAARICAKVAALRSSVA